MAKRKKKERQTKLAKALSEALKSAKPSVLELAKENRLAPKIGLGVESKLKAPQRVRREDVQLDEHTKSIHLKKNKSSLYTAGWSLKEAADE